MQWQPETSNSGWKEPFPRLNEGEDITFLEPAVEAASKESSTGKHVVRAVFLEDLPFCVGAVAVNCPGTEGVQSLGWRSERGSQRADQQDGCFSGLTAPIYFVLPQTWPRTHGLFIKYLVLQSLVEI